MKKFIFTICVYLCATVCQAENSIINISDYDGLPGDGLADKGIDTKPAFDAALLHAKQEGIREIHFNKGTYIFTSAPKDIDFGITIKGHGKGRTVLLRKYSSANGFITIIDGAGGSIIEDIGILSAPNTAGGYALKVLASPTGAPDFLKFSNLYISSQGHNNWDVTVLIDGAARVQSPIGVRDVHFINCSVFGGKYAGMQFEQVVALDFIGGGVFRAGGDSGKVIISGNSNLPSYYVNINTTFVDGMLAQNAHYGNYKAYFTSPITNSSNSKYNTVIGTVKGSIQPFWQFATHLGAIEP